MREIVARVGATEADVGRLADALARAAALDGTRGVVLCACLRHLHGGPDPEVAHDIGMRRIGELNRMLGAHGLPTVVYDEHCFRFVG